MPRTVYIVQCTYGVCTTYNVRVLYVVYRTIHVVYRTPFDVQRLFYMEYSIQRILIIKRLLIIHILD